MSRYRKKPVVIEAFQMTLNNRWDNSEWPDWLHEAWNGERGEPGSVWPFGHPCSSDTLRIGTLEGVMEVQCDDWIIKGVKGELYACKPDIFEQTYRSEDEPE